MDGKHFCTHAKLAKRHYVLA